MPAKTSPSSIRCLSALSLGYLKVCLMFSAEMRSLEFYPYLLGRTKAADTQRVWKCQHTLCHSVLSHSPGGVRDPSQHIPFSAVQLTPALSKPGHKELSPQSYTNLVCLTPLVTNLPPCRACPCCPHPPVTSRVHSHSGYFNNFCY